MTRDAWRETLACSRGGRLEPYLRLAAQRPDLFATPRGGMTIPLDRESIARVEETIAARYFDRGDPPEWASIGIVYQDPYLSVLRDAVVFLDGSIGVHHRTIRVTGDASGVAVLPLMDGRILLLRHFRHPLRDWSWEIPRGAIEPGATPQDALRAELWEEAGATVGEVIPLGRMFGATGFMGLSVLLYAARITSVGGPALDEGVAEVRLVEVEQFEEMVRRSEIVDSFTLGAFLHARLRGAI